MRAPVIAAFLSAVVTFSAAAQNGTVTTLSEVKSPEPWTQAPTGFRDVPFGATLEQAQAVLGPMKCNAVELPVSQTCSTKDRHKAFKVGSTVINTYYHFFEGKLVGVDFMEGFFSSTQKYGPATYDELATAFEQKFGTPTVKKRLRFTGIRPETNDLLTGHTPAQPYDYASNVVEWENDTVHAYLTEAQEGRLSYGTLETKVWERAKEEAQKNRQTAVTPF